MNKRFALTNINQLVRNIFSNGHQLPTRRNTPNGTTLVPMRTLISNLSSAIKTDVKPPTTNTSKQNDSQLELLCFSLTLVISQSFLSDKERTPSTGNTRDRDRSDQKKSPGEPSYMYPHRDHTSALSATSEMLIDVPNNSVIFTIELKKLLEYGTLKTALPPYAFVYHKFPDGTYGTIRCDINLVNTDDLGPGLCTRTRSTHFENNPHTPSIIEFVPKSSCITYNAKSFTCNLCGEDLGNADKEKFLRNKEPPSPNPNFMKSIINHNLNLRTNTIVTKTSSSLTTQGHQLFLLPPLNLKPKIQAVSESKSRTSMDMIGLERYRNWQERKESKHSSRRTTSGARTTTGQKDLSQTNRTTATTGRGQHQHKALLSTCRKRKRLCPLRPAMPNLIQLGKNPLSKNRVECYHYCKNYGSIDLTNIGFRLRHLCSLDLHSAPPKHGILILNG